MDNRFSVLIVGCKKHEEIAKRFYNLIDIFWKDIKENTVFCTDQFDDYQKSFTNGKLVEEKSGNYAERIKKGLEQIKDDYVLLLLDDYFLTKPIDDSKFIELLNEMKMSNIEYCKLIGLPICFKRFKSIKGTFRLKKFTHYGISLQPSIWRKDALEKALSYCGGSSAWEVESGFLEYQHLNYEKCITFNINYLHIKNAALRGCLTPGISKLLKKNKIEPLNIKKVSWIKFKSFMLKQHIAMHLPRFVRKIGKKIGSLFGKKYYSES